MAYLFLVIQIAISLGMLALFGIASAFQGEYLRWSTPTTKVIDLVTLAVLLAPLVLAIVSFSRVLRGKPPVLSAPVWFAAFLACGFATAGLVTLKEKVAYASKHAAQDKHREELLAAARAGDGEKACELVVAGDAPAEVFPVCKAYVDGATSPDERWRRFALFTSGGWLSANVIPESEQVWFARGYFTAMLEATPGSHPQRPVADATFDDLLNVGSALSGVGRPELLSHAALCAIAELIPAIEAKFADRLAAATTQNAERATYFKSVIDDARTRAGNCAP